MIFLKSWLATSKACILALLLNEASDQKRRDRTLLCCNLNQREFSYGTNTSIYHRAMGISGRSFVFVLLC